jgi:hypothetical protein
LRISFSFSIFLNELDARFLAGLLEEFRANRRPEIVKRLGSGEEVERRTGQTRKRTTLAPSREPDVVWLNQPCWFVDIGTLFRCEWHGSHAICVTYFPALCHLFLRFVAPIFRGLPGGRGRSDPRPILFRIREGRVGGALLKCVT